MADFTSKERETIQRALGIIEGAASAVDGDRCSMLVCAVEMIDEVLDRKRREEETKNDR